MFGGLLYILQEIKVGTVIIGKQYESCENYEEFQRIVDERWNELLALEEITNR